VKHIFTMLNNVKIAANSQSPVERSLASVRVVLKLLEELSSAQQAESTLVVYVERSMASVRVVLRSLKLWMVGKLLEELSSALQAESTLVVLELYGVKNIFTIGLTMSKLQLTHNLLWQELSSIAGRIHAGGPTWSGPWPRSGWC